MPITPRSSYYNKDYRQAAALIRARQPFLIKNIITGSALFAFTICICKSPSPRLASPTSIDDAYTIHAVSQDDFSDVPIPDAPAQPPHTPNTSVNRPVSAAVLNK
ncbi:MAG: cytochrome c oxidase assembly mitochondrial [Lasallia pustulata]|uniref:Cytochrome c oxidase assembly factor 3 n=1 Tax=Lasallia pustulata TaxID=136370 RepID=A0A5M8PML0_9LECA|nr:MAG: cytochrome c oxidase assembly mitochondrial [Lasallia pustulata]